MKNYKILFLTIALLNSKFVLANDQILDDQEIINVETLYNQPSQQTQPQLEGETAAPAIQADSAQTAEEEQKKQEVIQVQEQLKKERIERLTDLNKLSPFREISVIQKKYLPKSERFQLFAAVGTTTNSPWFLNLGAKLGLGYFFSESFGLELTGTFLSNSERQVAKEIRETNGLQPEKFINTKSHVGLDFVWAPIYGKVNFLNETIIPFDMYFSIGAGSSSTNSQEGNNTTYHIGTGQIFALSKAMAFRWDYSWNMFNATPLVDKNSVNPNSASNTYNDLVLTAGISFFFPEVSNR